MNTVCVLAALLGPLAIDEPRPEDTPIKGKPVSHWIDMLKDPEVLGREEALEVLLQAGPAARPALPAVRELLKDPQVTVRFRAALAVWKIDGDATLVVPVLTDIIQDDANYNLRVRAVHTLGQFHGGAEAVAPVLVKFLNDKDDVFRSEVTTALELRGTAAIPALLKGAEPGSPVRRQAIDLLGQLGARAADTVPTLTIALKDDDPKTRTAAAVALWRVDRNNAAIPVLVEGIKSNDPVVRTQASDLLFSIRPRPRQATDAFVEAFKSPDFGTRVRAADALWDLHGNPDEVLPTLSEGIKNIDFRARGWALETLRRMGPKAKPILPVFVDALGAPGLATPDFVEAFVAIGPEASAAAVKALEQNPGVPKQASVVKQQALMVLSMAGPDGVEAIGSLANHPVGQIRTHVAQVLGEIGGTAPEKALPILAELLKDKDRGVRLATLLAYGSLGPVVGDAPTPVLELLKDPDPSIRTNVLMALWNLRLDAKTALPVLEEIAAKDAVVINRLLALELCWRVDPKKHPAAEVVKEQIKLNQPLRTVDFMARIGPDGRDAIPQMVELLAIQQPYFRQRIFDVLIPFGVDAKAAGPVLVEQLKDPQVHLRVTATIILIEIGEVKPAATAVSGLLKDSTVHVIYHERLHAALRKLGPDGGPVLPALRQVVDEREISYYRFQCAVTLAKLDPSQKDAAVAALTAITLNTTSSLQLEAAAALLELDRSNGQAMEALKQGLADIRPDIRRLAAQKLGQLGTHARSALPLLRKLSEDEDPSVRNSAAAALWKVDMDAKALAMLTEAIQAPLSTHDTRAQAVALLGDLGADGKEAVPVILRALRDRHPSVRSAAQTALKKVDPEAARKAGY